MKATFAFLADTETHNLVRKLSWDIHKKYCTGINICLLPPHVSIKQPFAISSLEPLEGYMAELAGSMDPFTIHLTGLKLVEATMDGLNTGVLWLNVQEMESLRQLHDRVNRELTLHFGDVSAAFDGPEYNFHMTVALGTQPIDMYSRIHAEFADRLNGLRYIAREIAMFVHDDHEDVNTSCVVYKILPLGVHK